MGGAFTCGLPGGGAASAIGAESQTRTAALAISRACETLREAGPHYDPFAARLDALRQRLEEERFHLAVLGQFKRGKSTLLNALLGAELLPSAVIPLTAIPTLVRYGSRLRARVVMLSGDSGAVFEGDSPDALAAFLGEYVTETSNPGNRRGVREVEVEYPSSLLQQGVVLIDTPGIGSTFRHNTEATLNFLPQCDAALFVFSPDPPITEVEVAFLKEVLEKTTRTIFVLNKADYLSPGELDEARSFLRAALRDHAGVAEEAEVFCVSARDGLRARHNGDEAGWAASGMRAVKEHLVDFLANQKSAALQEAICQKAQGVLSDAGLQIGISLESLRMPVERLEERLEVLRSMVREVESQRVAQRDVLEGDRKRTIAFLEEQAASLRRRGRERLLAVVLESLPDLAAAGEERIREVMAEAVPAFFEREIGALSRAFEHRMQEVFEQHTRRAGELVDSIRGAAAEMFSLPYQRMASDEGFELKRRPYWVTHQWSCSFSMLPENFFDRLMPARIRRSRAMRRLTSQINGVVLQNVENVRWPTLQGMEDAFRRFARQMDVRHQQTAAATRDAIEAALIQRREHADAVEADVARLESAQRALDQINRQIQSLAESTKARKDQ